MPKFPIIKIQNPQIKKTLKVLLQSVAVLLILSLVFLIYLFVPLSQIQPNQNISPSSSFDESLRRFDQLQAKDGEGIRPECHSTMLNHGKKTQKAIVLFHGFLAVPNNLMNLVSFYLSEVIMS